VSKLQKNHKIATNKLCQICKKNTKLPHARRVNAVKKTQV